MTGQSITAETQRLSEDTNRHAAEAGSERQGSSSVSLCLCGVC